MTTFTYKRRAGYHWRQQLIIGIDFDGTIFKWGKFPTIGEPVPLAIETIKELLAAGHTIVIWTCRDGDSLIQAKQKLQENNIYIEYFNQLPNQEHLSSKLDVDIQIDDKTAGCPLIVEFGQNKPYVDWEEIRALISPIRRLKLKDIQDYEIDIHESNGYDYAEGSICKAWDKNGIELTDEEIEWLNEVGSTDEIQSLVLEQAQENAISRAEWLYDAAKEVP
jgi:hypothetical protein